MTARAYEIILISGSMRVVRTVIAHASMQATRIAIGQMPDQDAPLAIICKPLCRLADEPQETVPCSA